MAKKKKVQEEPVEEKVITLDGYEAPAPAPEPEVPVFKKIQLFDIIKAIFVDRNFIWNLTDGTANQNVFMINRRMAIQYPMEANFFNKPRTNALDVVKFWSDFLYNGSMAPGWIYTKADASKAAKANATDDYGLTMIMKRKYADKHWLSMKDIDDMMRFFPDIAAQKIKAYYEIIKDNEE